jgi:hypothetical protein
VDSFQRLNINVIYYRTRKSEYKTIILANLLSEFSGLDTWTVKSLTSGFIKTRQQNFGIFLDKYVIDNVKSVCVKTRLTSFVSAAPHIEFASVGNGEERAVIARVPEDCKNDSERFEL